MRIVNNVSSLNSWRNLSMTDNHLSKSLERLSSGYRINRAADDAAGLAISENMRAQIRGLNQAVRNAQDGISLVQTAEGSLGEIHTILQRMRELAVQAANGTLQPEDRLRIQAELDNLTMEITRITNASKFNNKDLVDGSLTAANISDVTLQIGPNSGQTVTFEIGGMDATTLNLGRDVMIGVVDNGTTVGAGGTENASNAGLDTTTTTVSSVGAGITAGTYQVRYDAGDNTVQLFDSAGSTAIGGKVTWVAGSTVTIGDANTAQTMKVALGAAAPAVSGNDVIRVGSGVGEVTADDGANDFLANTNGVVDVGWGLASGSYNVVWNNAGTSVQLFSGATAIGNAVTTDINGGAIGAGDVVEIGDSVTGRTVRVTIGAVPAANATGVIRVTNNEKSAESAKFNGGAKVLDARVYAGLNVSSQTGASTALDTIDTAISEVSRLRSELGAIQNRLEHTVNNLQVVSENLVSAESRIRDVDMALEMAQFTKNQILMQAGTAMLAQANAKNQAVLQLLQ